MINSIDTLTARLQSESPMAPSCACGMPTTYVSNRVLANVYFEHGVIDSP